MRSLALAAALVFASAGLAACAPRAAGDIEDVDPDARITTEAGLEAALGQSGFLLSPRGFTTDPLVSATGTEYVVRGTGSGYLQVYTFDSAEEAQDELNNVAATGAIGRTQVYQSGPLVVAQYGADASLGASLTRLLGTPMR